jgi:hypothetical protein
VHICANCRTATKPELTLGAALNELKCKFVVQEKLYVGPVVKKEFHLTDVGSKNGSVCAKLSARCEWDASNARVWLHPLF